MLEDVTMFQLLQVELIAEKVAHHVTNGGRRFVYDVVWQPATNKPKIFSAYKDNRFSNFRTARITLMPFFSPEWYYRVTVNIPETMGSELVGQTYDWTFAGGGVYGKKELKIEVIYKLIAGKGLQNVNS